MAFLATLARFKRGDLSLFLVAALFSALLLPTAANAAALPPQSYEAVLLWLSADFGVQSAIAPIEKAAFAPALTAPQRLEIPKKSENWAHSPIFSLATAHCGFGRKTSKPIAPQIFAPVAVHSLSAHEVARLSGVCTNVWRN